MRQRDLSGLIVIDFIDMESNRNQNAVERKLKEAVRNDRARIQIGSISQFGLLEMSRQRLRPSLAETVSDLCPHCQGTGRVRSIESAALQALRSIESEAIKGNGEALHVFMHASIAIYILNNKRDVIAGMEERFGISISLHQDDSLVAPAVRFGEDPLLAAAVAAENQKTAAAGGVAARTRTGITAPAPKPKTIQHQSRRQAPKAVMMKTVRTGQSGADGAANAAAESGGVIMARTM